MFRLAQLVDLAHLLALALWLAALAGAGVAAAGVFSQLPRTGLVLPEFRPYLVETAAVAPEELTREYSRIAGGMVMAPIFEFTDLAQLVAAGVAAATLFVQVRFFPRRWPLRRPSNALRVVAVVVAAAMVAWHSAEAAPRMNRTLESWWSAARANDPQAAEHRARFAADHRRADALFRLRAMLVLASIGLIAVAGVPCQGSGCDRREAT